MEESAHTFTPEEEQMIQIEHDVDSAGENTGVVIVSFNVPDKLNALTVDMGKVFEKKIRKLRSMCD